MSYIVKNCPATGAGCCGDTCPEITDCPLKQIITECRNAKIRANDYARNPYSGGIYDEANRILDFLDIQEVE
jgi:hypothetical protein